MRRDRSQFQNAKLSIIVPVFNEATHINEHLDLLLDEVEDYFTNFEVIVVSDGSTDGTDRRLLSFRHPDVRPIIVDRNTGKGNAVRSGFAAASGDFILFIDGGMEIHPKEIRIFMGLMELYECDMVIGSKRHPQSRVEYPWYRRSLSWLFQRLVHFLFDIDVTDTQVGIKLFSRDVVQAILPHLEINRYGFDLEVLTLAKLKGYDQILEAPIRMDYFNVDDKKRSVVGETWHTFKIGLSLLKDLNHLYRRMRSLQDEHKSAQEQPTRRAG